MKRERMKKERRNTTKIEKEKMRMRKKEREKGQKGRKGA